MHKRLLLIAFTGFMSTIALGEHKPGANLSTTAKNNNLTKQQVVIEQQKLINNPRFSVEFELFPYIYKEPEGSKIQGPMLGFNGSYSHYFDNGFIIQPELRVAMGSTKYSSPRTGSNKNNYNFIFETRLLVKKGFVVSNSLEILPFLGLGYRNKTDDGNELSTTGFKPYERKSVYYYLPIGLNFNYTTGLDWDIAATTEYDIFLKGTQFDYPKVRGVEHKLTHKQKSGFGARGEILITKSFEKHKLSIGPFIHYWNIKKSKVVVNRNCIYCNRPHMNTWERKNTTKEFGLKIKFDF